MGVSEQIKAKASKQASAKTGISRSKRLLRFGLRLGLGLLLLTALVLGIFTIIEYRPGEQTEIVVSPGSPLLGTEFSVLSYNIGYAGLGKEQDFFMDGGQTVRVAAASIIQKNLAGIAAELKQNKADFYFLQEVDKPSKRSYYVDELGYLEAELGLPAVFANNWQAYYVPYPFPPIGRIDSGLVTLSAQAPERCYRQSLPVPFAWPERTVNLKRCLLVSEYELAGREQKLVLLNLHLEAYDTGVGKIEQSKALLRLAQSYYEAGHYVLAGGDWNQSFPGGGKFPLIKASNWQPGLLQPADLPLGWQYCADNSVPSCRLNDQAYSGPGHQHYLLDGFLASPNIELGSIKTIDRGFTYSDHQPVLLRFKLR